LGLNLVHYIDGLVDHAFLREFGSQIKVLDICNSEGWRAYNLRANLCPNVIELWVSAPLEEYSKPHPSLKLINIWIYGPNHGDSEAFLNYHRCHVDRLLLMRGPSLAAVRIYPRNTFLLTGIGAVKR
jgi:hypothetical protein